MKMVQMKMAGAIYAGADSEKMGVCVWGGGGGGLSYASIRIGAHENSVEEETSTPYS